MSGPTDAEVDAAMSEYFRSVGTAHPDISVPFAMLLREHWWHAIKAARTAAEQTLYVAADSGAANP